MIEGLSGLLPAACFRGLGVPSFQMISHFYNENRMNTLEATHRLELKTYTARG